MKPIEELTEIVNKILDRYTLIKRGDAAGKFYDKKINLQDVLLAIIKRYNDPLADFDLNLTEDNELIIYSGYPNSERFNKEYLSKTGELIYINLSKPIQEQDEEIINKLIKLFS